MSRDDVLRLINNSTVATFDPPLPLMRKLPPVDPFPVDALEPILGAAAHAIHDRVRAPIAIGAQSVPGAATLLRFLNPDPEERAAIVAEGADVPRAWAEGYAALCVMAPPAGF